MILPVLQQALKAAGSMGASFQQYVCAACTPACLYLVRTALTPHILADDQLFTIIPHYIIYNNNDWLKSIDNGNKSRTPTTTLTYKHSNLLKTHTHTKPKG